MASRWRAKFECPVTRYNCSLFGAQSYYAWNWLIYPNATTKSGLGGNTWISRRKKWNGGKMEKAPCNLWNIKKCVSWHWDQLLYTSQRTRARCKFQQLPRRCPDRGVFYEPFDTMFLILPRGGTKVQVASVSGPFEKQTNKKQNLYCKHSITSWFK